VTLTNQNSTHEDIKKRLNLANACNHSLQNILSSCSVPTSIQTITYLHLIFFLILHGHETGSHIQERTWAKDLHKQHTKEDIWVRERNWQD